MKKIPSLFKRDHQGNRQVINEVLPGSEWVQSGEGVATRKYDGTSVAYIDSKWYKRYDCKPEREKPTEGIPCIPERDPVTGHWPWWVPITSNDKWHKLALDEFPKSIKVHVYDSDAEKGSQFEEITDKIIRNTTYELVGPKINGNRDNYEVHQLVRHGDDILENVPTLFPLLREWLETNNIEGVVWHHPDGRMVKIKRKDFGLKW